MSRKTYPTDVSDDEWAFVAPYLTLMTPDARQRRHEMQEIFNALRWIVRAGSPWRLLPTNFPCKNEFLQTWEAVYQHSELRSKSPEMQRWIKAECFEAMAHDLREVLRVAKGRDPGPSAVILDARTGFPRHAGGSTPESGHRAGFDGHKMTKGSKVHIAVNCSAFDAVDTLGHLLALSVTPANWDERTQVGTLAERVQEETGQSVEIAFANQGYNGPKPAQAASESGICLSVVRPPGAKRGFVLLPKRGVVERDFAWASRFRRLARDYERLPQTLAGIHFVVFAGLMLAQWMAHITNLKT